MLEPIDVWTQLVGAYGRVTPAHVRNLALSARRRDLSCPAMQAELEPTVRIRELLKDRVDFVLENVDLAYVLVLLRRRHI